MRSRSSCLVLCDHTSCPCERSLVKTSVRSSGLNTARRNPVSEIQSGSIGLLALISSKEVGPSAVSRWNATGSGIWRGMKLCGISPPALALRIVFSISFGWGWRVIHPSTSSWISSSSISLRTRMPTAVIIQRWHPSPAGGHSGIPKSLGLFAVSILAPLPEN